MKKEPHSGQKNRPEWGSNPNHRMFYPKTKYKKIKV